MTNILQAMFVINMTKEFHNALHFRGATPLPIRINIISLWCSSGRLNGTARFLVSLRCSMNT
ncbi:hypothetical protein T09_14176 [Trichinella sp. T9]|nr:hypothetical protein T09_14176 [Trichinella sp. T9]